MTPDVATQHQAALELTRKIAANPALALPFLKILELVGGDVEKLDSLDLDALTRAKEALPKVELPTEQNLRATNQIAGREITLGDSPAIEMHVPVNGQIVRAVLSDASFDKSRSDQGSYAQGLGGRLATREENRAVANDLLEKEQKGSLNTAETKLLKTYSDKFVRDSEGGLDVGGRRVDAFNSLPDYGYPFVGALVVLPLAESK